MKINKRTRNKSTSVIDLKKRLGIALVRLGIYQKKFRIYRQKYWIQTSISVLLILTLVILLYQEPITKAAPETDFVTVTSDVDWNLGILDDITVSSGAIQINGDGGAGWINEAG